MNDAEFDAFVTGPLIGDVFENANRTRGHHDRSTK